MIRFGLFFSAMLCCLLSGCADDTGIPGGNGEEKAYMRIEIPRRPGIMSRTIGSPTAPGTAEENLISDLTIYLTNGSEIVKIDDIGIYGGPDYYISDLIGIDAAMVGREYRIFLVANPKKSGFSPRATSDFRGLYTSQPDTRALLTPGQMVMSNQVEQAPPVITVTEANTMRDPARASVSLDRLAAKITPQVSVNFAADFTDRPKESAFFRDHTFTVRSAGLLNAPTEFNLEQLWSEGGLPVRLLSPTWNYRPEAQYYGRYYNTIDDYADGGESLFVPFGETAGNGYRMISSPFYCLENNSPFYDYTGSGVDAENQVKTKYKGLATGVIFKIQALKNDAGETFYRYRGVYYSDTETDRTALSAAAGLSSGDFGSPSVLRSKGIGVYENGNIYYTYWIKDNNPAYSGDDYDLSYAILRNSSYMLKANRLTSIGDDIPGGGYGPDEPIDRIEQIEIVAVSQDWSLVEVTHEFN